MFDNSYELICLTASSFVAKEIIASAISSISDFFFLLALLFVPLKNPNLVRLLLFFSNHLTIIDLSLRWITQKFSTFWSIWPKKKLKSAAYSLIQSQNSLLQSRKQSKDFWKNKKFTKSDIWPKTLSEKLNIKLYKCLLTICFFIRIL